MNYDRREQIKTQLIQNGIVYLNDLCKQFPEVSSMTLRRDLELFEHDGISIKIRGGAKYINTITGVREQNFSHRVGENIDMKIKIAKKALSFIETGRSVFLDSGTTIMCLANILPDIKLSILTSGPNIALEVLKKYTPTVNLIGGHINRDNLSVSGALALSFVKDINIDIAFIAPSGFSSTGGFTCGNYAECEIKKAIVKKSNKTIVLMDSTKIEKSLPFTFSTLKDIDILITEKPLSEQLQKAANKANTLIIVAE